MPRLTNQQYLSNERWLRGIWFTNLASLFTVLSSRQQWDLHTYFVPTNDTTDNKRLQHRRLVTERDPALPVRAGIYLATMRRLYDEACNAAQNNHRLIDLYIKKVVTPLKFTKSGRKIGVTALARPEPDLRVLARALIRVARDKRAA